MHPSLRAEGRWLPQAVSAQLALRCSKGWATANRAFGQHTFQV